jgi:hypothetical protein
MRTQAPKKTKARREETSALDYPPLAQMVHLSPLEREAARKHNASKRSRRTRKLKPKAPNSYLLHRGTVNGQKFAVIASGFDRASDNRKTGDMIQIWFILEDMNPVAVVKSGLDAATICQGCPFAAGNGCYVNVGQAPLAIWKAFKKGLPTMHPKDYPKFFSGRKARFGAYGNPTLLPISKVKAIAKATDGWTGYFHNWRTMAPAERNAYNAYFMASTETQDSFRLAQSLQLRVFHVSPIQPANTVECLSDSRGLTCAQCQLCQGWNKPAKSVWINPHGSTVKKATAATMA